MTLGSSYVGKEESTMPLLSEMDSWDQSRGWGWGGGDCGVKEGQIMGPIGEDNGVKEGKW